MTMSKVYLTDKGVPVDTYNVLMLGPGLLRAAQETCNHYLEHADTKRAQVALSEWQGGIVALQAAMQVAKGHGQPVDDLQVFLKDQDQAFEVARRTLEEIK